MKVVLILLMSLASPSLWAQTATLRGTVADETGAVIPRATVTIKGPAGLTRSAVAGGDGAYVFTGLPAGSYTIEASAPDLVLPKPVTLRLASTVQVLNIQLKVVGAQQQVTVQDEAAPTVSADASNNASATVLQGKDLDTLSDNSDDLIADLLAIAGPSAGPGGASLFIDGFSNGDLPPKSAIREIRINQNPFSPEYDKLGLGRIEILTKPGTDKFRGSVGYNFANDAWNSRNAYAAVKAPFHLNEFSGTVSGPLHKRASFNLNLVREMTDNGNIINGVTLDPQTLIAIPFNSTLLSTLRRTGVTPRLDFQLGSNHTVTVRYSYNRDSVENAGVGGFNLVSQGYSSDTPNHTVQFTETSLFGAGVVNEVRFQYYHPTAISQANTAGSAIQVLGAFNGGGNPVGHAVDRVNSFELQDYVSVIHANHALKLGARLRNSSDNNSSPQNFAGTFTFSGGVAPQLDANNSPVIDGSGQAVLVDISSIESYRRTLLFTKMGFSAAQIRQLGGGASQFSINAGDPVISGSQFDLSAFLSDDWKARPNLTLNLGLRYETQTNIHDHRDFAPRVGLAWLPGPSGVPQKSVIRVGFGVFYDRFNLGNTLTARRYNGIVQQQYVLANPDFFPVVPSLSSLAGPVAASTIQEVSSSLRAPYLMQSAVSFERQLPFNTTAAVTYANSHGLHQLRSQDINAPLPGTYSTAIPGSGVFPAGRSGPILVMESAGLYNQSQLILNVNSKVNRNLSLTTSYMYSRAMSNTDGLGTLPASPYTMVGEYGPAASDIHNRVSLAGTITLIGGIQFNPLLTANSRPPFNITAGRDLYGDTLFNARPGIANDPNKPGVIATKYGVLDPNPTPDETLLPRNFGRGPGQIMLNMRVGKTFTFGGSHEGGPPASGGPGGGGDRGAPSSPFATASNAPSGGSPGHHYNLTISMQIRNLTNHNNPGAIIGNITSPLFGQANQPAGSGNGVFSENANNRRLELQTRLSF